MIEKETRAAFAKRMGVNKSTITRWGEAGRLVEEGGLVLVAESVARVAATTAHRNDVAARHAEKRGADIPLAHGDPENAPEARISSLEETGLSGDLPATGGRQRYQTLTFGYENQTIKLEMALRRGLRFPREAVKHEANGLGSMLRAALERMIDIAAPQLAAEKNPDIRRALMANELDKVKRSIKREFPLALRRMREAS